MQHVEIFEIWKHSIAFHSIPQIISGLSSAKGEVADDLNAIQHHLSQTILSIASQVAALHLHHPAISNRSCKDHWRANLFLVRCQLRSHASHQLGNILQAAVTLRKISNVQMLQTFQSTWSTWSSPSRLGCGLGCGSCRTQGRTGRTCRTCWIRLDLFRSTQHPQSVEDGDVTGFDIAIDRRTTFVRTSQVKSLATDLQAIEQQGCACELLIKQHDKGRGWSFLTNRHGENCAGCDSLQGLLHDATCSWTAGAGVDLMDELLANNSR